MDRKKIVLPTIIAIVIIGLFTYLEYDHLAINTKVILFLLLVAALIFVWSNLAYDVKNQIN